MENKEKKFTLYLMLYANISAESDANVWFVAISKPPLSNGLIL